MYKVYSDASLYDRASVWHLHKAQHGPTFSPLTKLLSSNCISKAPAQKDYMLRASQLPNDTL